MNSGSSDPETLLDIVTRLDGVIQQLRDGGLDFSAQLVSMARLELMMTVHRISEQEVGELRSLSEGERKMLS